MPCQDAVSVVLSSQILYWNTDFPKISIDSVFLLMFPHNIHAKLHTESHYNTHLIPLCMHNSYYGSHSKLVNCYRGIEVLPPKSLVKQGLILHSLVNTDIPWYL